MIRTPQPHTGILMVLITTLVVFHPQVLPALLTLHPLALTGVLLLLTVSTLMLLIGTTRLGHQLHDIWQQHQEKHVLWQTLAALHSQILDLEDFTRQHGRVASTHELLGTLMEEHQKWKQTQTQHHRERHLKLKELRKASQHTLNFTSDLLVHHMKSHLQPCLR